jgi:mannose-6-phosphate isomerase-like protein (cupin superfamily)
MHHELEHEQGLAAFLHEERVQQKPKFIVRASEVTEWNLPERGQREWLPASDLAAKTIGFHIAELAPEHRSGTHRHTCEALIYIITGSGRTYFDDEPVDWSSGDTLYIPPMIWHSHENTGEEPARVIGMWNIPLLESLGLSFLEERGLTSGNGDFRSVRSTVMPA